MFAINNAFNPKSELKGLEVGLKCMTTFGSQSQTFRGRRFKKRSDEQLTEVYGRVFEVTCLLGSRVYWGHVFKGSRV